MKKLFTLLLCLLSISGVQTIKAADEIYAVLSSDKQTMTLYYDEQRVSRGGVTDWWLQYNSNVSGYSVRTVIFHASMADARPVSTNSWFCDFKSLTDIQHLNFLNTSNVDDMSSMFKNCQSLTSINVSDFDIWMVGLMNYMFYGCKELTTIYCNSNDWRRHGAWSEEMFQGCVKLVGGNGTTYNSAHVDISYAQEDTDSDPGYFTAVPEIYIVPSDDKKTLTMYYDYQCKARSGWKYWWKGEVVNGTWEFYGQWEKYTTKVILDVSMKEARPTSTAIWFRYFSELQVIEHLDYLNTSNVTDMSGMFYGCKELTSLDVSKFNTSNATNMSSMFENCHGLTSLDVSKFNTSNVRHMSSMFENCSGLTILDVSKLNTSNVRHMSSMFEGCYGLTSLDVSKFNTSNVTNMSSMFKNCYGLTSLDVSKFNTSNVTDMSSMFEGCYGLNFLDLLNFDTQKVERINYLFKDCESLIMICCKEDMTSLPTEYQLTYIFQGIEYTETVQNDNLFTNCNKLVGANGTAYSSDHTGLEYARPDKEGQPGYFSSKIEVLPEIYGVKESDGKTLTLYYDDQRASRGGNTDWAMKYYENTTKIILDESVKEARPDNLEYWFADFNKLTEIEHLDYLNTSEATTMNSMFLNCYALTALDMSKFNTKKVESMASMFGACTALKELNVNNLDVQKVTDMWGMFNGCTALKTIECNNDWSKQLPPDCDSEEMFEECTSLVGGNKTAYSSDHTDASYARPDEDGNPGYFTMIKTAIKNVQRDKVQGTKVIKDGVLYLMYKGTMYNVQGQKVN